MSAVRAALKKSFPFSVSAGVPGQLKQLAARAFITATQQLELLVVGAVAVIVRGQPAESNERFIARLRELAAQPKHPRAEVTTSYSVGAVYLDGIRQLQNDLGLPRSGLVVEYLVRAAWDVRGPDDDGGDDELERRRKSTSYNLHVGRPRPLASAPDAPLTGQLNLLGRSKPPS